MVERPRGTPGPEPRRATDAGQHDGASEELRSRADSPSSPGWLPYGVVVGAVLAVYVPAVFFGFTYFDDHILILGNQAYLTDASNLLSTFTHDGFSAMTKDSSGVFYRPILWISLIVEAHFSGTSPALYHAVNVMLHAVASCLVFLLLIRLGYARGPSLCLSLLFAVHPVLVQAVAWIPGRNDLLLAVFVLLTTLSLLAFLRKETAGLAALTLLCWSLALFTKESAIGLAAVAPLLVWTRLPSERLRRPSGLLIAVALGWLVIIGVWIAMRSAALGAFPLFRANMPHNITMFVVYVGKTLVPYDLSVGPRVTAAGLVIGSVVFATLGAMLWISRRALIGTMGVGLLWYFVFLAPALLAPELTRGLEHRLYVPMIGMLIILADAHGSIPEWLGRWPAAALASLLIVVFAVISVVRLPVFSNDVVFWESRAGTLTRPGVALSILATRYYAAGDLERAEDAIRRAMSLLGAQDDLQALLRRIEAERQSER